MVIIKKIIAILFVVILGCSFCFNTAGAAPRENSIKISIDTFKIYQGESFNLIIEIETHKNLQSGDLNYKPLAALVSVGNIEFKQLNSLKKGFKIYQWKIPTIANKVGIIKIPSMDIGKEIKTSNFEIMVNTVEVRDTVSTQQNIVKTQLRNTHPMSGQLTMYRLEISKSSDFKIENITPPSAKGAKVELFAERTISKASAGRKFNKTLVREYKVFFNEPGQIKVKSPIIQCLDARTNKRFIKKDKDIIVDVTPNPEPSAIVSDNLSLAIDWTPKDKNEVEVGTPITRTITIRATNTTLDQLPKFTLPKLNDFDAYEENTQESEKLMKNKQVISTKVIRQVFVPKKNHTNFVVNEISFKWVNPNDKSVHTESIPTEHYIVDGFSFNDYIPQSSKQKSYLIALLFGLILLGVFIFYSIRWYKARYGIYSHIHSYVDHLNYWKQFNKMWSNTDPFQARNAIIIWAQKRYPTYNIVGINDVPFFELMKEEANKLSAACWSQNHAQWNGTNLYKIISKNKNYKKPKAKQGINPFGLNGEIYETVQRTVK
ncbi:MAG: BatD family protein [Succinivibrionaceae bacterium]